MLDDICENSSYAVSVDSMANLAATKAITATPKLQTKVYRRRWFMLFIFVLVSFSNAYIWLQYSIINNIVMR